MSAPAEERAARLFWRGAFGAWLLVLLAAAPPLLLAGQAELTALRERTVARALQRAATAAAAVGAAQARGGTAALPAQLAALRAETPGLRVAAVTGQIGRLVAHSDPERVGELLVDAYPPPPAPVARLVSGSGGERIVAIAPLAGPDGGAVYLELDGADPWPVLWAALAWPVSTVAVLLIVGTLAAGWIARAARTPYADSMAVAAADRAAALNRQGRVIRSREALLRAMSDASPLAAVMVEERGGAVLHLNDAFAAMWDLGGRAGALQRGEVGLGELAAHCNARAGGAAVLPAVAAGSGDAVIADEVVLADGRVLRRLATPVRSAHEGLLGRLYLFEDITTRKRAEVEVAAARDAALLASRAKTAFLATMSHELRTPLNAILGTTDTLLAEAGTGDARDQLTTVRQSADVLLDVISELLDFSQLEAGAVVLETEPFEIAALVQSACARAATAAAAKGLGFAVRLEGGNGQWVRGDRRRLRQVLAQLTGNAVKFTERGGVEVMVRAAPDGAGAVALEARVADTGPGISAGQRDRLFAPFTQADGTSTRRYGGTGLGLAVARGLVELMGGELGLSSACDEGSTFWVALSLPAAEAPAAAAPDRAPGRGHVLLAEDNPVNQRVALRLLQRLGYTADVVANGREAAAAVAHASYDAVLMDCMMPEMDGYAATAAIRRLEGADRHTPIIALTANVTGGDRAECLAAGMDDYIAKPIDADTLGAVLARHLDGRPMPVH